MNKTLIASSAILISALASQSAFAESTQILNKDSLIASAEGYLLDHSERAKPRRSALFAMILDQLAQRATLAKLDSASPDKPALSSES